MTEFIKELIKNIINEINKEGYNITIKETKIYLPFIFPLSSPQEVIILHNGDADICIINVNKSIIEIIEPMFLTVAILIDLHDPNSLKEIKEEIKERIKLLNYTWGTTKTH